MFRLMAGIVLAASVGGCTYLGNAPGGRGYSADRAVYRSTPHTPMTVSLRNTWTGEVLWTWEIPVGEQLVVRFSGPPSKAEAAGQDRMRWSLMPLGQNFDMLDNEMVVPPPSGRRLEGSLRDGPELASASWSRRASEPAPPPPASVPAEPPKPAAGTSQPPVTLPQ